MQEDPFSLGICSLNDILLPEEPAILQNITFVPIDINGNGKIDYKEDVYSDLATFTRGVWIGKYPKALSSSIYSVTSGQPRTKAELSFLEWIVTGGQALLDNHGFRKLEQNESQANARWIAAIETNNPGTAGNFSRPTIDASSLTLALVILLAVLFGLAVLLILFQSVVGIFYRVRSSEPSPSKYGRFIFAEDFVKSQKGLFYDRTHTWAFMDRDGLVKVGVDDFLQHVTGPITRIKMSSPGTRIKKGKHVVSIIQEGKQLEIASPVSGIIREQNSNLENNTSLINTSPYTDGWIYKIEPSNWLQEVQFLSLGKGYMEWLKSEFQRLKDFLGDTFRSKSLEYAHVMQEGGELKDGILEELGPSAWEDFQTNFLDVSS